MTNKQVTKEEKTKAVVEQVNKLLLDNNLVIVPVTTIINNTVQQRIEVIEKPEEKKAE